ncbi:sirohydrochlorin chelatase [Zavarzinella formosa]|uniref:sirohydrochlorin chelatase n=1 Tax=Zavarzinella formosa TaxID=360055 RepID=UPI000313FF32|nr:CbiX/SirB N-terminal domain-containing protein [Zavarzinella formosa]
MTPANRPARLATTALLLIAHGSRRAEANADLEFLASRIRERGEYLHVQPAYLELCPPDIIDGGGICVEAGATRVILLPYFLSAGIHVVEDLTAARDELMKRHPGREFTVAEPLGRHPLLTDIMLERAAKAI